MDIGTILGLVVGFVLIIVAIVVDGSLSAFFNLSSLLIVIGGTVCATLVAEKLGNVLGSFRVAMKAFLDKSPSVEETIATIAGLAVLVRKDGLLALDGARIDDPFLAKGIRLAVDGVPADEVNATLRAELVALKQRHKRGQKLFRFMATTAPSMGMVGTLIGLVQMLRTLDDPGAIGPSMAIALLTTLYGALVAFLVCGPIAEKLEHRSNEEAANMIIVLGGMDSILKGDNARIVQEKLEGLLAPKQRKSPE